MMTFLSKLVSISSIVGSLRFDMHVEWLSLGLWDIYLDVNKTTALHCLRNHVAWIFMQIHLGLRLGERILGKFLMNHCFF